MKLPKFVTTALTTVNKSTPTILAVLAGGGVVATVIFAVQATRKAEVVIDNLEKEHNGEEIPKKELVKAVAPIYIPTIAMGTVTIGCIIGSVSVSEHRRKVYAKLCSLSEVALAEYQDKVTKMIGEKKEREIRDEITLDKMKENPPTSSEIIITGAGKYLFYDSLSGRYFESTIESVKMAENQLNKDIIGDLWVTVNDWYYLLGLPGIDFGKYNGWNVDRFLDVEFVAMEAYDGRPCLGLNYRRPPVLYDGRD